MAVAEQTTYNASTGNGVTTVYPFTFKILAAADLQVYVDGSLKTLNSDYTVTGVGDDDGGDVTFTTAPANGTNVVRTRAMARKRDTDYQQQGDFLSTVVNPDFDRAILLLQDLAASLGRSIAAPVYEPNAAMTLPAKATRANKYPRFNANGDIELATMTSDGSTLSQSIIGAFYRPQSTAEGLAGVTPTNYFYDWGDIRRYGATAANATAAVNAALAQQAQGGSRAFVPAGTWDVDKIDWPANNLTLTGEASAYAYNSSAAPKSILRARGGTSIILDLVQTGLAEDRTGNHIVDLGINGNSISAVGIDVAGSNIIERCRVWGNTTAGVRLSNFTNGTRIVRCGLNQNSGWGLQVEGVSTTTYSVTDTNTSLNTLGGIDVQAGVLARFENVISESNSGPGLRMYKPNTHTNAFEGFTFDNCWFEDNAATAPNYVLVIDAGTSSPTAGPQRVKFNRCRFTASVSTRKYMNINVGKWIDFEGCQFDNSTASDAITWGSNAQYVSIDGPTNTGSTGITAAQMDAAIATGSLCWWHDPGVVRAVGGGAPAAAFLNSWVNYGGGFAAAKYYFDRDGSVVIEGSIKTGSSGTVAFTLPAGYRPSTQMAFPVDANGSHGLVYVEPDGDVLISTGSSTVTHLNGIRFQRAAA